MCCEDFMKNSIVLFLSVALTFGSCQRTRTNKDFAKDEVIRSDSISERVNNVKAISCDNPSKEFLTFIALLEEDQYDVSSYLKSDSLKFFKLVKGNSHTYTSVVISYSPETFFRVLAERKFKLTGNQYIDNYYPSFHVAEICFGSDSLAEIMLTNLGEIIYNRSDMNGKNYDYILQNGSRLIYISTSAKIFESNVLEYRKPLENIITSSGK